ncbi:hypothetical protein M3Y94_00383000 [Aphelenchoides besseyi]|nr:hypothetical protein M3Y94_00383000 [Aphelenchoides besseyi]
MLGYPIYGPKDELSGLVGTVTVTKIDKHDRFLGAYGASPGFSGGGVFADDGSLLGMCIGDKDPGPWFQGLTSEEKLVMYAGHVNLCRVTAALGIMAFLFNHLGANEYFLQEPVEKKRRN